MPNSTKWMLVFAAIALGGAAALAAPGLPSETPEQFTVKTEAWDYVKREEMIPMRDGVKLKTFILVPKTALGGAKNAPMLLTRTPYNAAERVSRFNSPHLAAAV